MRLPDENAALPEAVRLPSGPIPEVPPPEALVCPRRADDRPWTMSGRRARVILDGIGGVQRVEGDGGRLLDGVEVVGATGANVLLGPRCTRRELVLPGGSLSATVLVPDALPGVVLQWTGRAPGAPRELPLRLLLPRGLEVRHLHRGPGILWVSGAAGGILLHAPGVDAVPRASSEDGGTAIRWDLPLRDGPATLLVMAAPEGERWTSLQALAGAAAHHRRGEILALGEGEPGLALETGVGEMDEGVAWSRAWLRDRLLAVPGRPPGLHTTGPFPEGGASLAPDAGDAADAPAWIARAAAATGDREVARAALGDLSWDTPWTRLHAVLALARYVAWTADGRPLESAAPDVLETFTSPDALAGLPGPVVVAVHEALTAAGEAVEVGELSGLPRPGEAPAPSRMLPVLGSTPAPPPGAGGAHPWLATLAFREEPSAALRARTGLAAVVSDPTTLDRGTGAVAVLALIEGMLGARPDATFARLGLAPCLPPSWTRFRARGLRAGEGSVEVEWRREGELGTWTLRPREGSVPLTAVFSPWLPWPSIAGIRVDDGPAELEVERRGDWSRIRLQLPVDGPHTIEVEGEGPRATSLP